MLAQFFILFLLSYVANSATYNCPSNQNCNYNCSSLVCNNLTIYCPTTEGNSCQVTCSAKNACTNTTIHAGPSVSKFTLNTVAYVQTQAITINSSASEVEINCFGNTCYKLELRATSASQVTINCDSANEGSSCLQNAWLVSFSKQVTVSCQGRSGCITNQGLFSTITSLNFNCHTAESCLSNSIYLQANTQATVSCAVEESCAYNFWSSYRDDNLTFAFPQKLASQNEVWNISNAALLVVNTADNAINDGIFNLDIVSTFLFKGEGYARTPYTQWNRNQVTKLYLQEMGAKSHWLTDNDDVPFVCDNNKPCFIRSDFDRSNSGQFKLTCPQDESGKGGDICHVYCVGDYNSCNNIYVYAMQSSSVVVTATTSSGFEVLMDSSEVKNTSQLQMQCIDQGCYKAQVYTYQVYNVYLDCTGSNACTGIFFNSIGTRSSVNIGCNSYLSCNSGIFSVYGDGFFRPRLQFISNDTMSASSWDLADLQSADLMCLGQASCFNMTVDGNTVDSFHMTCNGISGLACDHGKLNITGSSNVTLTCSQNGCMSSSVYCPPQSRDSSCNINCLGSQSDQSLPACKSMDIYTTSSFGFGNAVNLTCQLGSSSSCEDVYIHCGQKYLCSCPVTFEEDENKWYCDGQCGTDECVESSHKKSKTNAGVIAVAVIIPLLVMIALIVGGGWWWSRRRQHEEIALLKPRDDSINKEKYETYQ